MAITFVLNEHTTSVEAAADTPLLWVLRDHFRLTGTKFGCGAALCGACTVHIGGRAARSCSVPLSEVAGKTVMTIEGLSANRSHPVQLAWISEQVPQCGYCQSGMIMAAAALLAEVAQPSEEQIDRAMTNICRCGTYARIRRAIGVASGKPQ